MNSKIARTLSAILFLALLVAFPRAERTTATVAPPEDGVALYQALLDLQNPWTVMCVAAHPDDEDGTSLIVMRHKYGAHTVSLFSTFGEGGQNAIGPELYEELGAIRARETMAAAEIQGSEPHFLGLKDFGFRNHETKPSSFGDTKKLCAAWSCRFANCARTSSLLIIRLRVTTTVTTRRRRSWSSKRSTRPRTPRSFPNS